MQLNISNQTVNNGKQLKNDKEDGRSSFSKKLEDEAETERCLQIQRLQVKKLSNTLKATQDRLKVLKAVHEEKIDELSRAKDDLDQLETELHKTQNELERTKQMNINWQNTAINKCNLMHAMFTEWKETQDNLTTQITYPPVGYVTETESHIHLGRGEWLPYNAYALAISNISMKNRKVLFRNISVALLGYDALAKTTITGKGSNRNQGTKVPESKLDPKKLLAIKDIYRHFCITELRMDQIDAELEAGEANERIRKKISQLKGIKNKPMKSGQNILGNTAEVLTEKEDEQEIRGGMINEEERVMETEGDEKMYNQGVTDELVGDYIVDDEGNDKEGNGEEGNDEGGNDEEGNDEEGNDEERNDEVNDVGDDETMADEGVDNEEVNDDDAMYDDEVDNEEVDDDEAMDDDVVDNKEVDDDEAMDDDEVDNEEVDDDEAMDDKVYEEQIYDDSIQIDDFNCSVEKENYCNC
ncbi:MATH and LRR domain-containing protein PFE0570w-like [Leptopilina boulardi]|uniref:MATH and LRR domain-containing protein PFE0570w-like n=1 Tax=Leptopilina boulardi TaxID=63433 RepID=UPI0021F644DC|nr:MATH and LRR domain-containing protein PFE0570w-like [Leptopilina boulardi]